MTGPVSLPAAGRRPRRLDGEEAGAGGRDEPRQLPAPGCLRARARRQGFAFLYGQSTHSVSFGCAAAIECSKVTTR